MISHSYIDLKGGCGWMQDVIANIKQSVIYPCSKVTTKMYMFFHACLNFTVRNSHYCFTHLLNKLCANFAPNQNNLQNFAPNPNDFIELRVYPNNTFLLKTKTDK